MSTVLMGVSTRQLTDASQRLSERYRGPRTGVRPVRADDEAEAYVAGRLPATFTALTQVFREAAALAPEFAPASHLDLGAGTGAAAWAAAATWQDIIKVALVEREASMLHMGQRLRAAGQSVRGEPGRTMNGLGGPPFDPRADSATWTWQHGDFTSAKLEPHDLVTISYALGELRAAQALPAARAAWAVTRGLLVIVEPGTPAGFELLREVRRGLLEDGSVLLAPCPHERPCPMSGGDWCHFAARVQRSALHRQVKGGQLPYEDEKFSYLVFSRAPARQAAARVLRHPRRPPRRVEFAACTATGLRQIQITRSHPDYHEVKKLGWGSALPSALLRAGPDEVAR